MHLSSYHHIHFIGIGGSSMSGLARLMLARFHKVTGSDRDASHTADQLVKEGAHVFIGHDPAHVKNADLVVYTTAVPRDNPELLAAVNAGIRTLERAEFLGLLEREYARSVSICGTHGKTSVTSMAAEVLVAAGLDPTVHIGGVLPSWGSNVRSGGRGLFLTEACEFHASFLHLHPNIALVLNIDEDHLDFFKDLDDIKDTFLRFLGGMRPDGLVILCVDDEGVRSLLPRLTCRTLTYGIDGPADLTATAIQGDAKGCFSFTATRGDDVLGHVQLRVVGLHNVRNALGVLALAHALDIAMPDALRALHAFAGVHRRFEHTGDVDGVHIYHDYGHNPAEFRTVVPIAASIKEARLYVVVQPHTYSRLKSLFEQYLTAFDGADEVLVTDIYAAREDDPGDIHATTLVDALNARGVHAVYTPTFDATQAYLEAHWRKGDIVLTLGCGNINLLNEQIHAAHPA